jgi:hypothetical protein
MRDVLHIILVFVLVMISCVINIVMHDRFAAFWSFKSACWRKFSSDRLLPPKANASIAETKESSTASFSSISSSSRSCMECLKDCVAWVVCVRGGEKT